MKTYSDILGWTATTVLLLAYVLLAVGMIQATSWYFFANTLSGAFMAIHGWERRAWPVVGLNGAYAVISTVGLTRLFLF